MESILGSDNDNNANNNTNVNTNTYRKEVSGYKSLIKNEDSLYQSYIYDVVTNKNTPLIQKNYSIYETDTSNMNIYIAFAVGGELDMEKGNKMLGNIYTPKNYYEQYLLSFLDEEDELNSNMLTQINTQTLLELSEYYGYKKVVIIDYSCDVCINPTTLNKISKDKVVCLRNDIKDCFIGRGRIKTTNKKNKRPNRTSKKTKKTRKRTKKYNKKRESSKN